MIVAKLILTGILLYWLWMCVRSLHDQWWEWRARRGDTLHSRESRKLRTKGYRR